MKTVAAFITLMVCVLSASAQKDSVIVNDGWRKDTIREKKQVVDTIDKDTEMIIWDNNVREGRAYGQYSFSFRVLSDKS